MNLQLAFLSENEGPASALIKSTLQAEQELHQREQYWQQVIDTIPQQVWTAWPNGQIDFINKFTREYSGDMPVENGIVQWMDVVHPDDLAETLSIWKRSITTGEPYERHQRLFHKDSGKYRWNLTRGRPLRGEDGAIIKWLCTDTDIEDEKNAAEANNIARAHLSLMVESAQDYAIVSIDEEGRITSWNSGAERIFGYEQSEIIGQPVHMIFTPEDCEQNVPELEIFTAAKKGRAVDERWHMRKNGERFYVSGTLAAMYDGNNEIKGFIKIARDMTHHRKTQDALIEARNAAEAANIAKSEFLANMSHEIRTPMNAVFGLSHILANTQPLTEKQKEIIKVLQTSSDALLALINDLLDISKIEARTVDLEHIPFSMTQIVRDTLNLWQSKAKEKGLSILLKDGCGETRLHEGDPTRIRQIVMNLCSNAIKFTDKGNVSIAIDCRRGREKDTDLVTVAVSDTGIGIAPEKLNGIFQKFVQADSSINRKYGGTGLGLAISKTLAELMGGEIRVTSEMGRGSKFEFSMELPRVKADLPVLAEDMANDNHETGAQPASKVTILLVEDYEANVLVAKLYLNSFGYDCDVAVNGREAVEKARTGHYAAILMDVQMHELNGLEATQLIRAHQSQAGTARVPIIGMTAHALSGDRERCLAVGMDDYITKPFNGDDLKAKIELAIKR